MVGGGSLIIGVVSDTHGLLRREALEALAGVQHVIHAGDVGSPDILPRLAKIAPVTAIRGNVDTRSWARELPAWETVTLAGRTIYVPAPVGVDMIVSGHSHRPTVETRPGVVYLNPGSAGPRRFKLPITLATVDLSALSLRPELHRLIE